jgi:hypothetical protein
MAFIKGVMASGYPNFAATGGTVTTSGAYTVHTFTSSSAYVS